MKPRMLAILSIPLATLFVVAGQVWLAAIGMARAEGHIAQLSGPNQIGSAGINQLPAMAPGVVLIGLQPAVEVSTSGLGVQVSDASLGDVFGDIGVQDIEPVFPGTTGPLSLASAEGDVDLDRIYRLCLVPDADIADVVRQLRQNPAVVYAEPDYLAPIITAPNDPLYSGQWGVPQINAPAAWDVVTGTTDVVVAVVDAGLDTSHPDLAGQLWTNPGEIAGNSVDDDNNGYVDDIYGWNLVDNNADLSDNTGHGTQVAGVIAAATDNGEGVAGVCWNCQVMIVKVTQPGGIANYSDIAAGVVYAAQKGAEVINLSLGGQSDSATLRAAIAAASQTTVVVGGAGNDQSSVPFYPAAYDDYVLATAGTTIGDTRASTSNYGTWVDVSAPGEVITTTFSGGGYGPSSGTSMAAAFASGLAGLLRSQYPAWSANMVRAHIVHTTDGIDSLNPGYEGQLGSGRINAGQAVTTTAQPLLSYESHAVDGELNGRPEPGSAVDLDVTLYNDWADATNVQATLSTTDTLVTILAGTVSYRDIAAYESGANATPFRFSVSSSAPYAHDIPFTLNVTATGGYEVDIPLTIPTSPGIIYVHGTLTTQTWTNDYTYIVDNDAGIAAGHTLTIEPGAVVRFAGYYYLAVNGTLIADGTHEHPIRFTSNRANPQPGDWERIVFDDSSTDATFDGAGNYTGGSIVRHAIFEYGDSAFYVDDAGPFIAHNTIDKMASACCGIGGGSNDDASAQPVIADNTLVGTGIELNWNVGSFSIIRNTLSGAAVHGYGQGTVAENLVSNVPPDSFGQPQPGIYASGSVIANRVTNCGEGIVVNTSGVISGNLLANNSSNGLRLLGSPTVVNNTILSNGGAGIVADSGGPPTLHQNNLITGTGQYALRNNTANAVDATDNWWGTTSDTVIQAAIYDGIDQFGYGIVDYSGYLAGPAQDAPAYVQVITLTPESPVGIQGVSFDVTFSRPMDHSLDPIVAFGSSSPYNAYQIIDNAHWSDDSHWRATYDITSLVPRGTYTISVSDAQGTDGMEIPTDTRFSFTVDYAGQITDKTPPPPPSVIAGGKEGDPSTVEAMWLAGDPDSLITGYRYAIGSTPGATDIVCWTTTTSTSLARSGLGLVEGRQYWLAVQARNVGGLWSVRSYSTFISGRPLSEVFLPLTLNKR